MKVIEDVSYGALPQQKVDLIIPEDAKATYVFMHGGGLGAGSRKDNMALRQYLAGRGIATVSVEYRMLPDVEFPEFIKDCAQAAAFTLRRLPRLHGLPNRVFVGGSSAGAYLAMMLAFDRRYMAAQGVQPEDFAGFIFDAGQPTSHFALLARRGFDERRVIVDEMAPLYHVQDARPGKPLLIFTAENDMPNRVEQNALLHRALLSFGYPQELIETHLMPGYGHCGYCEDVKPDGGYAYGELCADFILRNI